MGEIRNLVADMLDRIVMYACDAPADPTSADKVLIARANAMLQSLPADGGAWYPSVSDIQRRTGIVGPMPGVATTVIRAAIDEYRSRGGRVGGEVVLQARYIGDVWTDASKEFCDSVNGVRGWETRELIARQPTAQPAPGPVVGEPYCWAHDEVVNYPGQMCEMRVVGAPGGVYNTPLYRKPHPATVPAEVMEAAEYLSEWNATSPQAAERSRIVRDWIRKVSA